MKTDIVACPTIDALEALLKNRLPPTQLDSLTAHLNACPHCQNAVQELAASSRSWQEAAESLDDKNDTTTFALRGAIANLKEFPGAAQAGRTAPSADGPLELAFLDPASAPGEIGRIKQYRILEIIGRGGFGVVFKAFDEQLQRIVAIKALASTLAVGEVARQRFLGEARAAAAVTHPNVVTIFAVDEHRGVPYLAMQFVAGTSLQARLDQAGALELTESVRIGMQVAEGLAAAHRKNLVHRDVKPGNILLEQGNPHVKITDFGLARIVDRDANLSQSGIIAGTPLYMSPEQVRGDRGIDPRADLFSLGSVLYAMVTGQEPFHANNLYGVLQRVIGETPLSIRAIAPELPQWLEEIIAQLHAKNPDERFQSAQEVADLLRERLDRLEKPSGSRPVMISRTPSAANEPWMPGPSAVAMTVLLSGLFGLAVIALAVGWLEIPRLLRDKKTDAPAPGIGDGAKPPQEFKEKKDWPPQEFMEKKDRPPQEFKEKKDWPPQEFKGKKGGPLDHKGRKGGPQEFKGKKGPPPPEFDGKQGGPAFDFREEKGPPPGFRNKERPPPS